jgi:hypothetical protein
MEEAPFRAVSQAHARPCVCRQQAVPLHMRQLCSQGRTSSTKCKVFLREAETTLFVRHAQLLQRVDAIRADGVRSCRAASCHSSPRMAKTKKRQLHSGGRTRAAVSQLFYPDSDSAPVLQGPAGWLQSGTCGGAQAMPTSEPPWTKPRQLFLVALRHPKALRTLREAPHLGVRRQPCPPRLRCPSCGAV